MLIGHGGNGHKREPHILALARRLVRHHGIAAAAIDGPSHGDRAPAGEPATRDERLAALRNAKVVDGMISDWKATLDALQKLPELGVGKAGYWGLSMGTMFGLPFVAAAALFGAIGSSDKRLHAHPGAHAAVPPEELAHTEAFLAEHLQ